MIFTCTAMQHTFSHEIVHAGTAAKFQKSNACATGAAGAAAWQQWPAHVQGTVTELNSPNSALVMLQMWL
jgi:hypothetical protein